MDHMLRRDYVSVIVLIVFLGKFQRRLRGILRLAESKMATGIVCFVHVQPNMLCVRCERSKMQVVHLECKVLAKVIDEHDVAVYIAFL